MAKVAVIIPTHNRADRLGRAIKSVLNQTFGDFELMVVDDGSKDNPEEVVWSFADRRIRFIRHETARGAAAARNAGIRTTGGAYVAFLDDDDEWYPDKLAEQVAVMEKGLEPLAVVYGAYDIVNSEGDIVRTRTPSHAGDLHPLLLRSNPIGGTSMVLIRRESLESVGLFDERLQSLEDYDLYLRLSERFTFDFVSKPVCKYMRHPAQLRSNRIAEYHGLEILNEKHGSDKRFRRAIAKQYLRFGRSFYVSGSAAQGRKAIYKGLRLNPYQGKAYAYILLSLFGADGFEWISRRNVNWFR